MNSALDKKSLIHSGTVRRLQGGNVHSEDAKEAKIYLAKNISLPHPAPALDWHRATKKEAKKNMYFLKII